MTDRSPAAAEDVIQRLARDLRPAPRLAVAGRLAAGLFAGVLVSGLGVVAGLGLRPDMARATGEAVFWIKFAYALGVAGVAIWACERLARPDGAARRRIAWLVLPPVLVGLLAVAELAHAPAALRMPMLMGHSARTCPWMILFASLPPLAGLVWAVRGLAPTRLALTGLMLGVAAGGAGAALYALYCNESATPFLAVWYTLGVAAAGATGALAGPRLLRW